MNLKLYLLDGKTRLIKNIERIDIQIVRNMVSIEYRDEGSSLVKHEELELTLFNMNMEYGFTIGNAPVIEPTTIEVPVKSESTVKHTGTAKVTLKK